MPIVKINNKRDTKLDPSTVDLQGCQMLGNAIIIQAAEDFRDGIEEYRRCEEHKKPGYTGNTARERAMFLVSDCVRFFQGDVAPIYTTLDVNDIFDRLCEELKITPTERRIFKIRPSR